MLQARKTFFISLRDPVTSDGRRCVPYAGEEWRKREDLIWMMAGTGAYLCFRPEGQASSKPTSQDMKQQLGTSK
jgi:hypothetical protein